MLEDTAELKVLKGVETTPQLCTRKEVLNGVNHQSTNGQNVYFQPSKLQYFFFIIKFQYNMHSDMLNQHTLSENRSGLITLSWFTNFYLGFSTNLTQIKQPF